MNPTVNYRLPIRKIWQLTLSLGVIFYPIILYVNVPKRGWDFLSSSYPFFLVHAIITLFIFFLWICFTEWLLQRLSDRFGKEVLVEFRLPEQLFIVLTSVVVVILTNGIWYLLFRHVAPMLIKIPNPAQFKGPSPELWEYFRRSNNGLTLVIILSIFYVAANRRANRRLKDSQVRAERLQKETALAQFAALKDQVSPHFLFNSLSILSSLVHIDADLSEKFIDQLSRAYRYILEQKDNDRVQLKTELNFIHSYTFLLKIRFEESFEVILDVPEAFAQQYSIPPMTLQLLVENAVKHNRMTPEEPLQVTIRAEGDYLVVRNRIQPREQINNSTGIGLQNIINRYQQVTSRPVWVGEQSNDFVVKIPLLA